jgi:excisionase family DNA binding protein
VTDRLVDAATVADRLGVPVSWVRQSTRSGAIPHLRFGKYVRYDLDDVTAWIAACKHPGRAIRLRTGVE